MHALVEAIQEAGWFVYVVFAVAALATVAAFTALVLALTGKTRQPALAVGVASLALGIFVPATGAVGYALAMRNVFGAVASVDPSMRAQLLAEGISEAMNLVVFGAVCGAVPCLLALVAVVRAALRPKG